MNLSPHFTMAEMTFSQTATRHKIGNWPPTDLETQNLHRLALTLEQVRSIFDRPVRITSGYRSPELNHLIGGSEKSQHMHGLAADFIIPGVAIPDTWAEIKVSDIEFDQLINEYERWVHMSIASPIAPPRRQAFKIG